MYHALGCLSIKFIFIYGRILTIRSESNFNRYESMYVSSQQLAHVRLMHNHKPNMSGGGGKADVQLTGDLQLNFLSSARTELKKTP